MASNFYYPGTIPEEYNQAVLTEELERIATALAALEVPTILLAPQHVEPTRPQIGMIATADGSDWDPGHGAGVYEYNGSEWEPLFATNEGIVLSQTQVVNTTTETEIYSHTIAAESLHTGDVSILSIAGYYDTGAASDTWTLRLKFNGVTVHSIVRSSANNATNFGWQFKLDGTVRSDGASGSFIDIGILLDDDTIKSVSDATVHALDTTIATTVSATIQWGAAKATNDFRLEQGIITHRH